MKYGPAFAEGKFFLSTWGHRHGWLMKGRMGVWKPPLPGPLLHKCVEERENTPEPSLHEPAEGPPGAFHFFWFSFLILILLLILTEEGKEIKIRFRIKIRRGTQKKSKLHPGKRRIEVDCWKGLTILTRMM